MIGKKTSVKKMFFWLTAGMVLSMTAIILISFFLTQNIAVLWVGLVLTVCAALWMLFMVQLLGMRLSNFTSELCQILDDMMNRSQEPENGIRQRDDFCPVSIIVWCVCIISCRKATGK